MNAPPVLFVLENEDVGFFRVAFRSRAEDLGDVGKVELDLDGHALGLGDAPVMKEEMRRLAVQPGVRADVEGDLAVGTNLLVGEGGEGFFLELEFVHRAGAGSAERDAEREQEKREKSRGHHRNISGSIRRVATKQIHLPRARAGRHDLHRFATWPPTRTAPP